MSSDDLLNEKNISGKVEDLMYDITQEAAVRRQRDADMLDAIRSRQRAGSSDSGRSFMKGIKKKLKKGSGIKQSSSGFAISGFGAESDFYDDGETEVIDDELTEVMDCDELTEVTDDDLTEVMEYSAPISAVYTSGGMIKRTAIYTGTYRIGSKASISDIVLDSCHVSRLHAELIRRGDSVYVVDMGSTNGTYINGSCERLEKGIEYEVSIGDTITFADMCITIE